MQRRSAERKRSCVVSGEGLQRADAPATTGRTFVTRGPRDARRSAARLLARRTGRGPRCAGGCGARRGDRPCTGWRGAAAVDRAAARRAVAAPGAESHRGAIAGDLRGAAGRLPGHRDAQSGLLERVGRLPGTAHRGGRRGYRAEGRGAGTAGVREPRVRPMTTSTSSCSGATCRARARWSRSSTFTLRVSRPIQARWRSTRTRWRSRSPAR